MHDRNATILRLAAEGVPNAQIARQIGTTRNVIAGVIYRHNRGDGALKSAAQETIDRLSDLALLEIMKFGDMALIGNQWRKIATRLRIKAEIAAKIHQIIKAEDDAAHSQAKSQKAKR